MATAAPLPAHDEIVRAIESIESHRGLLGDAVTQTALRALHLARGALPAPAEPAGEQQRKLVSVLFLDMVGSTALSAHLDPEDVHVVMDGALAAYSAQVESYGGRVLQYAGDNLLAAFGTPVAREDDAERAVLAGLALLAEAQVQQRRLHELAPQLDPDVTFAVRLGIHTGDVLLGGGVDGDGTIRGQTVNLAARMEQTAPVGGLRISQATWRFVRGRFDMVEQPPMSVKGHAEPLITHLVRGVAGSEQAAQRGVDGVATSFLGRSQELVCLNQLADQLCQGAEGPAAAPPLPPSAAAAHWRQQQVLVVGEAGQGKTRLCTEFLQRAQRRHGHRLGWVGVQADHSMLATSYAVLQRLLTALLARASALLPVEGKAPSISVAEGAGLSSDGWLTLCQPFLHDPADAAVLGHLLGYDFAAHPEVSGLADDARRLRDRALHHLGQVIEAVAAPRAWVVWLDDLQWADAASLEALGTVMQRQPGLALLWLCGTRPEGQGRWPAPPVDAPSPHTIALAGLDADDQRRLANHLLTGGQPQAAAPAELLDLVLRRGEGNPYFIEETVNTLVDRGVIQAGSTPWTYELARLDGARLPATLAGLLQARLDALPADLRLTAQLASVVGERFWTDSLTELGAPGPAALDALQARGLVQALSTAGDPNAAGALQFHSHSLQQVAYNSVLKKVRRGLHARLAHWLAGQQPQRAAHEVIAEHHELGGEKEAARDQWMLATESAVSRFDNAQVMAHSDRAMALLAVDDVDRRLKMLGLQVGAQAVLDEEHRRAECLREFVREAELALRPSRTVSTPSANNKAHLAEGHGAFARFCMEKGRFDEALVAGERAIDAAENCAPEVRAMAIARVAQIHVRRARYEDASRLLHQALELANTGSDISVRALVYNELGNIAGDRGDLSSSVDHYRQAADLYALTPHQANQWMVRVNLAYNTMQLGLYSEACDAFGAATEIFGRFGDRVTSATVRVNYAMTLIRLGQLTAAAEQADLAVIVARQQDDPLIEAAALRTLGLAKVLAHNEIGDGYLQRAGELLDLLDMPILACETCIYRLITPLRQEDSRRLSALVDAVLTRLNPPWNFTGAEEPARAALLLVTALAKMNDERALEIRRAAVEGLLSTARLITSLELRTSYLQQVPEHRELLALGTTIECGGPSSCLVISSGAADR
ncbi:MAG: hypothetical protein RIQ60_4027 [Pseudomonadota bacterium]